MSTGPATAAAVIEHRGRRERWLADGIIAGFVAMGASTAALIIAYALANGAADSQGDVVRRWLWQLTHNDVVSFSRSAPAVAIAAHVVLGVLWAVLYAGLFEPRLGGPGWRKGMLFSLLPWLVSIFALLPAAAFGLLGLALSAGPLPPIGNLLLHLIFGFTLGQLYDASASEPAVAQDTAYAEPLEAAAVAHSEAFSAAGIVVGAVIGAAVGVGLAVVLPPALPAVDFQGWSTALGVGGVLAGGAVGGIVGSFAGLPSADTDPAEVAGLPDPFDRGVLPFLIPPFVLLVVVAIIVTLGSGLLTVGKSEVSLGPVTVSQAVAAAVVGIVVIGLGAAWLSSIAGPSGGSAGQSPRSSRETVSHSGH